MLGMRGYCAEGWSRGHNISRRGYILAKCIWVLDKFMLEKHESALELDMPVVMKAKDTLMRI